MTNRSIRSLRLGDCIRSVVIPINFLVFAFSALLTPAYGKLLAHLANGGSMDLPVFRTAGSWLLGGIVLAMVLAMFLRETGPRGRANP
jgi:uncharacterized membrane protein